MTFRHGPNTHIAAVILGLIAMMALTLIGLGGAAVVLAALNIIAKM